MYLLKSISIGFVLIVIAAGCSTSPNPAPTPEAGTFHQEEVSTTPIHNLHSNGKLLLAGTDQGAFKKDLNTSGKSWQQAGLQIDSSKVVDFVFLTGQEILAGIQYDNVRTNKPTLFKSNNSGGSWSSIQVNKPDELDFFTIQHLEKQLNEEKLFAYVGRVISSKDDGHTWLISKEDLSSGFSKFLAISKHHPKKIWTGGALPIFAPYLAKSEDGGETWIDLRNKVSFNTDATLYDLIVHPEDPDRVLVGAGGAVSPANVIRKSTDGGKSWETVHTGINTRTLTHSARNPTTVYASGRNAEGSVFFVISNDFGNSWETVEMQNSPPKVQINDMVSVMVDGAEVLYLGTEKGIYSYRFEE